MLLLFTEGFNMKMRGFIGGCQNQGSTTETTIIVGWSIREHCCYVFPYDHSRMVFDTAIV